MAVTLQTLEELALEAEAVRDSLQARREDLLTQAANLNKEIQEVRAEENAYRAAIARRLPMANADESVNIAAAGGGVDHIEEVVDAGVVDESVDPARPTPTLDWGNLARTGVVEVAVREISAEKGFATPAEIEEFLDQRNRVDTRNEISGALAHLNRTNKIVSVGRARWAINDPLGP
jgi:hypothetical protein